MLKLGVMKLHHNAKLPTFAHPGEDLAADLYSAESVTLPPHSRMVVKTGIAVEFPKGYGCIITGRSGNFRNKGLEVITGTVDQGYQGEYGIMAFNTSDEFVTIEVGDRIAQMRIVPLIEAEFAEIENFGMDTARGEKGYGSTGFVGEAVQLATA